MARLYRLIFGLSAIVIAGALAHANVAAATEFVAQAQPPRSDTTVRAVTVAAAPPIATLRIAATVGRLDGPPEYIFGDIETFWLGRDNSIYLGESGTSVANVRQYDSTGKYLRTFGGRRGDGPGEFRTVDGIAIHPDGRVLIVDGQARSISVFTADARFVTRWQLDATVPCADNSLFITPEAQIYLCARFGTLQARTEGFVRINSNGAIIDTLMPPPAPVLPPSRIEGRNASGALTSITFEHAPRFMWMMSRLGYFYTGRSDRPAIDLLLPTRQNNASVPWKAGDPITSLRMNVQPIAFSQDELAILRERLDTRMRAGSGWNMAGAELPRLRPAFWRFWPGADGRIFMSGFDPAHRYTREELTSFDGAAPHMYDIIEPSGRHVGRVRTEPGVIIFPGYGDNVLLIKPGADFPQVSRAVLVWPR